MYGASSMNAPPKLIPTPLALLCTYVRSYVCMYASIIGGKWGWSAPLFFNAHNITYVQMKMYTESFHCMNKRFGVFVIIKSLVRHLRIKIHGDIKIFFMEKLCYFPIHFLYNIFRYTYIHICVYIMMNTMRVVFGG